MMATPARQSYTLILLLSLVLDAISTPHIGIQLDWLTGENPTKFFSYSAIIKFNQNDDGKNPVDELSDGQLAALTLQAYQEMKAIGKQSTPTTMGALATGNEIYFASSVCGDDRGFWRGTRRLEVGIDERLLTAAGRCRLGGAHRKGGRCAEFNLLDLFYARNKNINLQGTHSRIIALGKSDEFPPRVYQPCGNDDENGRWGCWTFLRAISNDNPNDHLKDENLRFVPRDHPIDDTWPDGLQFETSYSRGDVGGYQAMCNAPSTWDPDHPDE